MLMLRNYADNGILLYIYTFVFFSPGFYIQYTPTKYGFWSASEDI